MTNDDPYLLAKRFNDFCLLNELDQVEILQNRWMREDQKENNEPAMVYIYARKRLDYSGYHWGKNTIIFKTKNQMTPEDAMREIMGGVKTKDIYFRKNYPIEVLP